MRPGFAVLENVVGVYSGKADMSSCRKLGGEGLETGVSMHLTTYAAPRTRRMQEKEYVIGPATSERVVPDAGTVVCFTFGLRRLISSN